MGKEAMKEFLDNGNLEAKKDRFPRVNETGTTYHRYNCPFCDGFVDLHGEPKHPLRKVDHKLNCEWLTVWLGWKARVVVPIP